MPDRKPEHRRRDRQQYERNRVKCLEKAVSCSWCGVPISQLLPVGHPQKAVADHIIPRSKGGSNDLWNLVAACWRCNARRQDKAPGVLLPSRSRKSWDIG